MGAHDKIRQSVAEDYAKAVGAPAASGCCCGGDVAPRGVAAQLAGYTADELAALPAAAVVNSFGCGNPLAFSAVQPGQVVLDLGSGAGGSELVEPGGGCCGTGTTPADLARRWADELAGKVASVRVFARKPA